MATRLTGRARRAGFMIVALAFVALHVAVARSDGFAFARHAIERDRARVRSKI